jgi:hypothetical protein
MQNYKQPIILALLLSVFSGLSAQQNFSLYHTESLPQRMSLNPALVPDAKWFIGLPGFNSLGMQVANTGFNINEISSSIDVGNGDTLLNLNKLLNVLSNQNYISLKLDQTWINFGFQAKKHFFSANLTDKVGFKMGYPKDLFRFIIDGNGGPNLGETFDFRFSADLYHYREFGLGYAYRLSDKLTLGTKVKYLQGISRAELKQASLKVRTRPEDYAFEVNSNVELNMASSLGEILPANGGSPAFNEMGAIKGIKNRGWGLDLGLEYALSKKLNLSGSIIDLGYINWTQNCVGIRSSNPNATYVYEGFPISSADSSLDVEGYFARLADSVVGMFGLDTVRRAFRSTLSTEILLGASYELRKNLKVNALFYGDLYNKRVYGGLTLGLYWRPFKAFSVNLNNTFYGRAWLNPGIALAVNAGAMQTYISAENFLAPVLPAIARGAAVRAGVNFTFGRAKSRGENLNNSQDKGGNGKAAPIDPTSIQ